MKLPFFAVASVVVLLAATLAPLAAADSAILGFTSYSTVQPAGINSSTFFAQAFTVGTAVTVDDIELLGLTNESCPCTARLDLTNNIGSSVSSSIQTFSFALPSGTTALFPVSLALSPGQYFLILSTGSGSFDWDQGASPISSSVATVNGMDAATAVDSAFPPASNFLGSEFEPRAFQLTQTSAAPEPTTLLLLGPVVLGILGGRRKISI
jgi:hypothetical protein